MILRRRASERVLCRALAAAAAVPAAAALATGCALVAGLSDHQPYPGIQVTAGLDHACLLMRTGEVWCWGANDTGQLGHRTTDGGECTTACPAAPVEGVSGAVQISAGSGFTCAVMGTGNVQCWGRNSASELGRMTSTMCPGLIPCDSSPAPVSGVSGAVQVSAGAGYACARTAAGAVMCWGDNTYGQLGKGDLKPATQVVTVKGLGKIADVSAALFGGNTCAAGDTGVWCWGLNTSGGTGHTPATQGDVMSPDSKPTSPVPVLVPGVGRAVTVRTGDMAGCAGLATGDFTCWGYDGLGCLGTKTTGNMDPPEKVTVLAAIASLDLRYTTTCALDPGGEAWCWGQSGIGALGPEKQGMGGPCDQGVHCQHQAQRVGLASVAQIATGAGFTVALGTDGTVSAWGVNDKGQLGHRPKTGGDTPCPANTMATCNVVPGRVKGPPP